MVVKLTWTQIFLAAGMLVTGSMNTISKKVQNDCSGYGIDKGNRSTTKPHKFDHPWFQTIIMFTGESFCLVGFLIQRYRRRKEQCHQPGNSLGEGDSRAMSSSRPKRVFQIILALPTVCDLVGTSLSGVGLVYVDASVWQMLRGSIIIFAGILSVIFLKRKLRAIHWVGMFIVMVGLALVGLSDVLRGNSSNSSSSKAGLGIIFILCGQVVGACQMIIEELFLKKRQLEPLHVVGMEGIFGVFFMAAIILPAMYHIKSGGKPYEDSLDAIYMIAENRRLLVFCLLYLSSIAFYNYFGLAVTKSLTAVHRALIDACRTMLVWVVGLVIYYAGAKDFGEAWDKSYGLLQVDGFLFLMIGTVMYNEVVYIPWLSPRSAPLPSAVPSVTAPSLNDDETIENDDCRPLLSPSTSPMQKQGNSPTQYGSAN